MYDTLCIYIVQCALTQDHDSQLYTFCKKYSLHFSLQEVFSRDTSVQETNCTNTSAHKNAHYAQPVRNGAFSPACPHNRDQQLAVCLPLHFLSMPWSLLSPEIVKPAVSQKRKNLRFLPQRSMSTRLLECMQVCCLVLSHGAWRIC